jgi:hypothetical protein
MVARAWGYFEISDGWPRRVALNSASHQVNMPPLSKFKRFDVRPLLKGGGEPLSEILKRVQALRSDEGLILIAPFLPSPLIELLGSQGFASKVERGEVGSWIVYFWREAR